MALCPFTGWFSVVVLLPVLGFLRFGNVIVSDKYVYLPVMGFLVVLAWLVGRGWGPSANSFLSSGKSLLIFWRA